MTLREQILPELKEQNEVAQAEIKKYAEIISAEAFAISTVTGGALAGAARSACQNRMQTASARQDRVKRKRKEPKGVPLRLFVSPKTGFFRDGLPHLGRAGRVKNK